MVFVCIWYVCVCMCGVYACVNMYEYSCVCMHVCACEEKLKEEKLRVEKVIEGVSKGEKGGWWEGKGDRLGKERWLRR